MQQLTTRGWRKIKSALYPLPPRAHNDYATHVPVLVGVAGIRNIERVLELGCGNYSTRTFLNREAFPHLKDLYSIENDASWGATMRDAVKYDTRCKINIVTGAISDALSTLHLESFDLIFVDDSTSAEERFATITAVAALHPQNPWTLIHDYEVRDYQRAAMGFVHRFIFDAYNPATGLGFNFNNQRQSDLRQLNRRIKANRHLLEPDDVDGWLRVLRK